MSRIDRCLSQIRAIRDVAAGLEAPYVARSRIGRLAMSTVALVAEEAGLPAPERPGPIRLLDGTSEKLSELAARLDRLREITRHIAQPSEPLDNRWKRGWDELLQELQILEELLERLDEVGHGG